MRRYRRSGVGSAAAQAVFHRLPGTWLVHQVPGNLPAQAFWRRVTARVAAGPVVEQVEDSGVTQRFTVGV
jgi:predicted acetyltransferase